MAWLKERMNRVGRWLAILTDWLLIGLGAAFMVLGWFRVDLPGADYLILTGGIVLAVLGFWYRHRRLQREKRQRSAVEPVHAIRDRGKK